ncbi:mannose-6-phosphate isomerase, type 2 [Thermosyntropha lipolytica DSM 11003]|uniref:Mannose-6-phosphate isomerase, type 2 n=1 Tax=Thermosyntropha lipolytica DSM 11003 TaxID=1123382 RepID=A0A1M5JID3_9FIRM|nr:glycosyltransferase family 4 protein [Thermosyntropha lipolytica]SHG40019.1 mannose-6-phosphate isomerase, type 2 [Thermosyntropha lipolytica DSM 11003]
MKIALLSPIAWRTPPSHYGPWERVVSLLAEGLVKKNVDVTLFATGNSVTSGKLSFICPYPYEENKDIDPKVWEALHISHLFEQAENFDLIHNHYDFLPLTYSRLVKTPVLTTIHGFSSEKILPVYQKYNQNTYYVSISNADRRPELDYIATVYHGIDLNEFTFREKSLNYLVYLGRIHEDKGTFEAIQIAKQAGRKLYIAGIIQDLHYFRTRVEPYIDNQNIIYIGSVEPYARNLLLSRAYALLHPIKFNEPFGLSVVEAMACGTPVIAFRRGSMPEVIKDSITGFLVDNVKEAAVRVKDISDLNRAHCRRWVEERFSQERMVEDYIDIYQKILSQDTGKTF